jgi:autotransporter-associated beta strand protein
LKVGSAGTGTIYLGYLATGSGVLNIGSAAGTPAVAAGTIAAGVIATSAGTGTVNFNHTDPGYTFGTQITGPTAVQQNGGVTILSGANTYTGGTLVKAGTLQAASGSALGAGSVSVSGGILDLGGSGALTLTLGTGANFVANTGTLKLNILGSGSYDQIVGNGGKLTIGGTLDLSGSVFTGGTYQLFSGFSTSSAGTFSTITGYDPSQYLVTFGVSNGVGTLNLSTIAAVPEPREVPVAISLFLGILVLLRSRLRILALDSRLP